MIGIFDSGAGGLSVLREIRKEMPLEDCVYFADNAFCPYGEKDREFIVGRAGFITEFLLKEGAQVIVVACNTATAAAISELRSGWADIPFIGMEPAVKPAAHTTRSGVVGVLATAGTLKGDKYAQTRDTYAKGVKVVEHIGSGFVELVESGRTEGPQAEEIVEESLRPLVEAGADTIVLGCTHYPFLKDTILKVAHRMAPERDFQIIDPAPAVVHHLKEVMQERGISCNGNGDIKLYASGDMTVLRSLYSRL
ncbi:MAG: glutamate racemase [Candidatus Cryptobacteroides sp.]